MTNVPWLMREIAYESLLDSLHFSTRMAEYNRKRQTWLICMVLVVRMHSKYKRGRGVVIKIKSLL